MDQNKQVDVGTLLQSVAQMVMQNQGNIDTGNKHGARVAQAFGAAAQAARSLNTNDAGQQFAAAAQAMRQQGSGQAVNFYANGLEQAAQQFTGRKGVSLNDLLPLLQSLSAGAQQGNPAQVGQGSMLDALVPAASAFMSSTNQGLDPRQAAIQALGSAVTGARGTANGPWGYPQGTAPGGNIDPGAASATNVIGGIVGAFLPGVLGALGQQVLGGGGNAGGRQYTPPSQAQSNDPLGGLGGIVGALGGLGGLGGAGGIGGIGNILGGLGGGGQAGGQPQQSRDFSYGEGDTTVS